MLQVVLKERVLSTVSKQVLVCFVLFSIIFFQFFHTTCGQSITLKSTPFTALDTFLRNITKTASEKDHLLCS